MGVLESLVDFITTHWILLAAIAVLILLVLFVFIASIEFKIYIPHLFSNISAPSCPVCNCSI